LNEVEVFADVAVPTRAVLDWIGRVDDVLNSGINEEEDAKRMLYADVTDVNAESLDFGGRREDRDWFWSEHKISVKFPGDEVALASGIEQLKCWNRRPLRH